MQKFTGAIIHVTALKHELGNNPVEARSGIAKPLLPSAERAEVCRSLGHDVVVQLEADTAGGRVWEAVGERVSTVKED